MARTPKKRMGKGWIIASFVLTVVAGAIFPDLDIFFGKHRSWTHDWRLPLAILCLLAVAYLSGQFWTRVLRRRNLNGR